MNGKIETIEGHNSLTILIPKTGHWLVIVLTSLWSVGWIFALVEMGYDGMLFTDGASIFFSVVFSMFWIFIVRTLLWHIRGIEKITLDKHHLKIKRTGIILPSTRKYEANLIDGFKVSKEQDAAWWRVLYGFAGGQITFDYWEHAKYFGQTVSIKEANSLVDLLNLFLSKFDRQVTPAEE